MVLKELISCTVSTLGVCGGLKRTDWWFGVMFLLWEGVVVLKELILTVSTLGDVVVLKEPFLTVSTLQMVWWSLKELILSQFLPVGRVWWS